MEKDLSSLVPLCIPIFLAAEYSLTMDFKTQIGTTFFFFFPSFKLYLNMIEPDSRNEYLYLANP